MLKKFFLIGLCGFFVGSTSPLVCAQDFESFGGRNVKLTTLENKDNGEMSQVGADRELEVLINVPKMSQLGIFPTGCESVSATMLLNFYEYNLSANDFIDKYLLKKEVSERPDPNSAFIGSPYDNNSYGCFAPCIAKAMNKILKNGEIAKAIKGEELESVVEKYLKKGIPVLVWTTMDMRETKYRRSWTVGYTDETSEYKKGDTFSWPGNEHCVVLVGYNEKEYLVNDPLKPKDKVLSSYEKGLFQKRYKEQGSQIVVIEKEENNI